MYYVACFFNIILWPVFYIPSYLVSNALAWVKQGFRDGKTSDFMR